MEVSTFFKNLFASKSGTDVRKRFAEMVQSGQGSMSKVYRARDRDIGRLVCLKVLDKEKAARFEARFPGLKRPSEGAILSSLHHKNIVQAFDHGWTTQGEPFLVMELIEGPGLNFLIETRNAQLNGKRVEFLIQIADGLEYIHQQKYLHRDMCPRNIMISPDGVAKIIDFGLSIPYTPGFCKPGNRTGTSYYLAPELIKRTTTDHRVDLFAFGVTAYEMFTGQLPWEKSRSLETLLRHINMTGKDPREFCPDLDDALAEFLIKAIKRNPNDRFQTAGAFRDALLALPVQDQ